MTRNQNNLIKHLRTAGYDNDTIIMFESIFETDDEIAQVNFIGGYKPIIRGYAINNRDQYVIINENLDISFITIHKESAEDLADYMIDIAM